MFEDWVLFWHLPHIKTNGKCHSWKYNKPGIKEKRKSFFHGYTKYLRRANNNHVAINIGEKQGWQYCWFFSTVESCLTITDIPKVVNLVELWICFNEKYLRDINLPHFLIKASIWEMIHSLKFKFEVMKRWSTKEYLWHSRLRKTCYNKNLLQQNQI